MKGIDTKTCIYCLKINILSHNSIFDSELSAEVVMGQNGIGRNGHGPKWVCAEMTNAYKMSTFAPREMYVYLTAKET